MSCVELFCEPIVLIIKRPFMPSGCWLCIESRACKEQTKPEVNSCSIFDHIQCLWVKLISRKIVVTNQFANEVEIGATQMILGWIHTVQVSVAFAFSFGMHAPFMFEYRWKRILQTLNIIPMA